MTAKEFERWFRLNIGPYAVPQRAAINDTALAVIGAGGEVLEGVHRPARVDYESDPAGLTKLRKEPVGKHWTCACGEPGVTVELPPEASLTVTFRSAYLTRRSKGPAKLCIRCDGLHLTPKFGKEVNA
jgi:hypothetical protein